MSSYLRNNQISLIKTFSARQHEESDSCIENFGDTVNQSNWCVYLIEIAFKTDRAFPWKTIAVLQTLNPCKRLLREVKNYE